MTGSKGLGLRSSHPDRPAGFSGKWVFWLPGFLDAGFSGKRAFWLPGFLDAGNEPSSFRYGDSFVEARIVPAASFHPSHKRILERHRRSAEEARDTITSALLRIIIQMWSTCSEHAWITSFTSSGLPTTSCWFSRFRRWSSRLVPLPADAAIHCHGSSENDHEILHLWHGAELSVRARISV